MNSHKILQENINTNKLTFIVYRDGVQDKFNEIYLRQHRVNCQMKICQIQFYFIPHHWQRCHVMAVDWHLALSKKRYMNLISLSFSFFKHEILSSFICHVISWVIS